MPHDVMISYSSEDQQIADAVCNRLEQENIRCWIAPRDIRPGNAWTTAITQAIDEATAMVLVFSASSNASSQVSREVSLAAERNRLIVPLRLEAVEPSGTLEFYLREKHWLDAMTPPLEQHISQLVVTINAVLSADGTNLTIPATVPRPVRPIGRYVGMAIAAVVVVVAIGLGAMGLLGERSGGGVEVTADDSAEVDEQLAKLWRTADFTACHTRAIEVLREGTADPSVPAYWRVISKQSMHDKECYIDHDPEVIRRVELEFDAALRDGSAGMRADDLMYQFAHFLRRTDRVSRASQMLEDVQQAHPDSNWKEGTAYYLGLLHAEAGNLDNARQQLNRLGTFDLASRMYHFESSSFLSVADAIQQLESTLTPPTSPSH